MTTNKYHVTDLSKEEQMETNGGFVFLFGVISYAVNTALVTGTVAAAGGAIAYSFESGKSAACNCH